MKVGDQKPYPAAAAKTRNLLRILETLARVFRGSAGAGYGGIMGTVTVSLLPAVCFLIHQSLGAE